MLLPWLVLLVWGAASADLQETEGAEQEVQFDERELRRILQLSPLGEPPLDATNRFDGNPQAERLGHALFFDAGLSVNGEISCATCHDPKQGFSDGKPVADTLEPGKRRTPALWNAAYGHWYFHDGRAATLWSQALDPIEDEAEMGGDRLAVLHHIAQDEPLRRAFEQLRGPLPELENSEDFPAHARPVPDEPEHPHARAWAKMSEENRESVNRAFTDVGKMIAAYERRLVSRDSAFDRFVTGLREQDQELRRALSPSAQRGLRLFLGKGRCRLCHNGPNFSDGEFHGLGLATRAGGMPTDSGRYGGVPGLLEREFTASGPYSDAPLGERARQLEGLRVGPENWGEFKTPSLRNVGERAPYMHAGQFADLESVLNFYSTLEGAAPLHQHQEQVLTARDFTPQEIADLVAFLLSLQGAAIDSAWTGPPGSSRDLPTDVPKQHDR